ncbi:MAG: choice-of-anchor B domain-containing protein [Phenylobacterium sp.]|jgi:choice-of-anchor B domain-containing protein
MKSTTFLLKTSSLALGLFGVTFNITFSSNVLAHAEHDKPRYISEQGVDKGQCDEVKNPCKSLNYVAEHANKGDQVLVASGQYTINDADSLFYLLSELVPVKAGYSTQDGFKQRNTTVNVTHLAGVPLVYADELRAKGFTVNTDQKALSAEEAAVLESKLAQYALLSKRQSKAACVGGQSAGFSCNNISLQAHLPLADLGLSSVAANDIWGFIDINNQREYAIIGVDNGVSVVDVTDPTAPVLAGSIASQNTRWRDIKVYQYFDEAGKRFKAYAYISADSASVGTMVLDLTQLPNGISLTNVDKTDLSAHNVYLSNVDYSTGIALTGLTPYLHVVGSNQKGGAYNSYTLGNPVAPNAAYVPTTTANRYTHDATSMVIDDNRVNNQCTPSDGRCEIFIDFNVNDMILWDKTDNGSPNVLSETTYPQASYIHSGWWSEDKQVVMLHDELDERNFDLNTTLRLFDVSDLGNPTLLSTWTGPTTAIDHNGYVRGSRYYMSNYERGLTILDISDPTQPIDVGFFDTYPPGNNTNFNGAWGVYPYLPSGNILVSDINSGLYILSDQTVGQNNQDSVKFNAPWYDVAEGENQMISVARLGNSGQAVSVQYETHIGSAKNNDFAMTSGTLSWAANDRLAKTISIATTTDTLDSEFSEALFVRLFNPTGGLALASPNFATVYITGQPLPSSVEFLTDTLYIKETDGQVMIDVVKKGDFNSPTNVNYTVTPVTANLNQDYTLSGGESGSIGWAAHESGNRTLIITPAADSQVEEDESFVINLSLQGGQQGAASGPQALTVVIRDQQSNMPPEVTVAGTMNASVSAGVTVSATATDPEGFPLSYQWTQVSGTQVVLSDATASQMRFTAPSAAATLVFEVSVSDDFGVVTSQQVTVMVAVATTPNVEPTQSSGGGGSIGMIMLFILALVMLPLKRLPSYNQIQKDTL